MPICRQCKHIADCQLDAIVNNLTFDPNFNAENCIDFEMFSNADRIRSMTDEELVKLIIAGCPVPARSCRASCKDCIMEWLKQPAEVE